ncbi:hypothetical protein LG296_04795 [Ureibacillus chungkukjangi]|uniref:hypothetical protein n=1 Tax=Ureibacillus chungkukjangi TaxID=1202712 RepID=UPI00384AC814
MESYIEVVEKSLYLTDTILEGLDLIQELLGQGKGEQTLFLFEDVLVAFVTIKNATESIFNEIKNDINPIYDEIRKILNLVISYYEDKEYANLQDILNLKIIPLFLNLREKLDLAVINIRC